METVLVHVAVLTLFLEFPFASHAYENAERLAFIHRLSTTNTAWNVFISRSFAHCVSSVLYHM